MVSCDSKLLGAPSATSLEQFAAVDLNGPSATSSVLVVPTVVWLRSAAEDSSSFAEPSCAGSRSGGSCASRSCIYTVRKLLDRGGNSWVRFTFLLRFF